jgi:predicted Zn-dependent protease with MMP-like domain
MRLMRIPRAEFDRLVAEAIEGLPYDFREKLENVEVIVEDYPTSEHYGERQPPPGELLLGLYHGVPLTERSVWGTPLFPARITIFQGPIERVAHTPSEIVAQVRRTVLHEIAHHFGIPEQRLRELGY